MAYLTIRIKGEEGYTRTPLDKERILIGRGDTCDIRLDHTSVSREHCVLHKVIDAEGERWAVEDLGSFNGTKVGETPILGRTRVYEKDRIGCGRIRLTFHLGAMPPEDKAPDAIDTMATMPCSQCGGWFSIAKRKPGDTMKCPHCGASQVVGAPAKSDIPASDPETKRV